MLTIESSLLYTHPAYLQYLDGMIVGTTYPLFGKNQLWVVPSGVRDYYRKALDRHGTFTRTPRASRSRGCC